MPTIRIGDQGEAEGVPGTSPAAGLQGDVARIASNVALANYMGSFAAGEIIHKFAAEDLAQQLKTKDKVAISISWG
jgi:hypothetical protein